MAELPLFDGRPYPASCATRKVVGHFAEVMNLAPAILRKLPAPGHANEEQQKGGLKVRSDGNEARVQLADRLP